MTLTATQLRATDDAKRRIITIRPHTEMLAGGIHPLIPILAPLLAPLVTPLISKAGAWVGKKVFGKGLQQSGAPMGRGLLRSGDRPSQSKMPNIMLGSGKSSVRAGDYPMPSSRPLAHYRAFQSSAPAGLSGGMIENISEPIMKATKKKATKKKGSTSMKAKMAALRAMKKKA